MSFELEKQFQIVVAGDGPSGVRITPDGTRVFIVHRYDRYVKQYDLSTPFDISTAVLTGQKSISTTENTGIFDIAFSPSGMNMYVVGSSGKITEYALDAPYSFTATLISTFVTGVSGPRTIDIDPDFSKIFLNDGNNPYVREFTLSDPWILATATLSNTKTVRSIFPQIRFLDGGNSLLACYAYDILKYQLSTPYDLSTLSSEYTEEVPYNMMASSQRGFCFSPDQTMAFIVEYVQSLAGFYLRQYSTGYSPYNPDPPPTSVFWTNFHGLREEI
ncbi:MAG TPA: hypothetical protein DCS09_11800 [Porphyromonadaceae bacterium]|nr:hypothetical protein [Porphyromonadaceae bacterium]